MATLEAAGRVHFCSSNDLDKKCLFDSKATEKSLPNGCKARKKVCTFIVVSFSTNFWSKTVHLINFKLRDVESTADFCKKVNKFFSFVRKTLKKLKKFFNSGLVIEAYSAFGPLGALKAHKASKDLENCKQCKNIKALTGCGPDRTLEADNDEEILSRSEALSSSSSLSPLSDLMFGALGSLLAHIVKANINVEVKNQSYKKSQTKLVIEAWIDRNVEENSSRLWLSLNSSLYQKMETLEHSNKDESKTGDFDLGMDFEAIVNKVDEVYTVKCTKATNEVELRALLVPAQSELIRLTNTYLNFRHKSCILSQSLLASQDVETNPGPMVSNDRDGPEVCNDTSPTETPTTLVKTYNVRGLNDEKKLRHLLSNLRKDLNKDKDLIVCLQESYIKEPGKLPYIWRGNYHLTAGNGNSEGCLTLLSSHLSIIAYKNIGNRAHVLACQKTGESGIKYIVANVYAPNVNNQSKSSFFEDIFDVVMEFGEMYDCNCILVNGDFNVVLKAVEVKNRIITATEKRMAEFL